MSLNRHVLHLKGKEIVPPDEDHLVEVGAFDALLPCRRYQVDYKVAVLGQVSPTLEFMLRLVKSAPGISEDSVCEFFGYSRIDIMYVLEEACGPAYVERRDGRLWLTAAGEGLFRDGENVPSIFAVEPRRRSIGFDFLSIAPQQFIRLDTMEAWLPELPIEDAKATGKVGEKVPDKFRRFFLELADRKDREQFQRRDLYSIDQVTAGDRFQVPVRVRTFAPASNPSVAQIDLSSWRPDHELADRPEIENSAALFVEEVKTTANQLNANAGYQVLTDIATEFLKEFTTRTGLAVARFWREAISRTGEVRTDRRTIPIVGSPCLPKNMERFLSVLEYGLRDKSDFPTKIVCLAPQLTHWGATTLQRDALTLLKRSIKESPHLKEPGEVSSLCYYAGKIPRYLEKAFDEVRELQSVNLPAALEILLVPAVAAIAVVHSPIGSSSGYPTPLGLASFDPVVLARIAKLLPED